MSFLNTPQYASVTTRLLDYVNDVMPRRSRIVLGAIVVFLVIMSIADAVSRRPAPTVVQTPPIVVVATPTRAPTGASGLAKEAGRAEPALALSVPTPTPAPLPTAEPVIVVVVAEPSPTVKPLPSPTGPTGWPPRWTIR